MHTSIAFDNLEEKTEEFQQVLLAHFPLGIYKFRDVYASQTKKATWTRIRASDLQRLQLAPLPTQAVRFAPY